MSALRTYVISSAAFAAVVIGSDRIYQFLSNPVPTRQQLSTISGDLTDFEFRKAKRNIRNEDDEWIIRISGKNGAYRFANWMPLASEIEHQFSIGDEVELLVDIGRSYHIWGIRRNGALVVDFDTTSAAYKKHHAADPLWGAGMIFSGLFCTATLFRIPRPASRKMEHHS